MKIVKLRTFSEDGVEAFRRYLYELKNGTAVSVPNLNTEPYSSEFQPVVKVDADITFSTNLEMAIYLVQCFEKAGINQSEVIEKSHNMWTWLTCLWLDQFTPMKNGVRKVRENARYICNSNYRNYYRHYIAEIYAIYSKCGKENSKLFLECAPGANNEFVEQLGSRQYIISNKNLIATAHKLYWNDRSSHIKDGSVNAQKPGNIRRFVKVVSQLDLNYDLQDMASDRIIGLLPHEFIIFLTKM